MAFNCFIKALPVIYSFILGYDKHDPAGYGSGNSRNGYYGRDLLTGLGLLEGLDIPRDRLGEFTPELLDKWQRATKPMDELVLSLYAKGMTTRDINDVIEKIHGKSYSPQLVTLITKEVEEERLAWENRPLKKRYIAIFIDAQTYKTKKNELFEEKLKLEEKITQLQRSGSSWLELMRGW